LTALEDPAALVERLVDARLWERKEGGYQIAEERGLQQYLLRREQIDAYFGAV
jgi:hypothetical protein